MKNNYKIAAAVLAFIGVALITALASFEVQAAEAEVDKMLEEGPTVVVCNSMALAYADGIYRYGEGYDSIDTVPPHPELSDPRDISLFRDLQASGMKTIKEHYDSFKAQADAEKGIFKGLVTIPDRVVAMQIAQDTYQDLERGCNATRDLTVIKILPNLGELTKRFIQLLESGTGLNVNFIKTQGEQLDENEHYGLEWQIANGMNYLSKWYVDCMKSGGKKSACKAQAWNKFFDYTHLYPVPTLEQCIEEEI